MAVDKLEFFKSAEQEYIDFTQIIETNLSRLDGLKDGKKSDMINKVSKKIKQANKSIQNMEMELNSVSDITQRQRLSDRIKKYTQNLNGLERRLKEIKNSSERSALLAGASNGNLSTSEDHRARLAMNTERLKDTSRSLDSALKVLEDTEVIGAEAAILTKDQGDQMRRARDRLADVNVEVGRGSRIIGRISRRQLTNKIILIAIILVIILAIFLVLFFAIILPIILKFKSDDKKENSVSSLFNRNDRNSGSLHGGDALRRMIRLAYDEDQVIDSVMKVEGTTLSGMKFQTIPTINSPEAIPVLKKDEKN